jgi:hypothetical protein
VLPDEEYCDGLDRLCNGRPAEGCECLRDSTRRCYAGPDGTAGVGICQAGTQTCVHIGPLERDVAWTEECLGEVLPEPMEICDNGLDDNCNGQSDERCRGRIMCPGNQTIDAGQTVTLSVANMGLTNILWTIISAPTGGAETAEWNPTSRTAATETFRPTIVGVYTIEVTATDPDGLPARCRFNITANSHGLRVELTWDGSGDVDLHLHNGNNSPWFSNSGGDDCYYSNTSTTWGARLDYDNTRANGPENIRIDSPAIGMAYTVAVHNYSSAAGRTATVRIFCGTTMGTTPTQTFVSRRLTGTDGGNCTSNDFWRIATITFTDRSNCTISTIDRYSTSQDACNRL